MSPQYKPLVILLVIALFVAIIGMACNKTDVNPVTLTVPEPALSLEQKVQNMLAGDCPQNALSGGNNQPCTPP